MIELHPVILEKGGKSLFAVLPYEEFIAVQELLADAQDLPDLGEAVKTESDAPSVSVNESKCDPGLR